MNQSSLKGFSTTELAVELAGRQDLVKPNGLLVPEVYDVRRSIGPIVCVDGVGIRRNTDSGLLEGGLIVRNTGRFAGHYCLVGGVVALNESLEKAIKRHFHDDIGADIECMDPTGWKRPTQIAQYSPLQDVPEGFSQDPSKHSIGLTYLVRLVSGGSNFGKTAYGQEAKNYEWFSQDACPEKSRFGYGMRDIFLACLKEAEKLAEPRV